MRTTSRVVLLVLAGLCAAAGTVRAGEPSGDPAAEQVREVMQKGVAFLKGRQQGENWESGGMVSGLGGPSETGLVVLALLETGAKPEDAGIAEALHYLRSVRDPGATVGVCLQTQALCRADPKKDAERIRHNVDELLRRARRERGLVGWDRGKLEYFGKNPPITPEDTWSAVLALHAASQAGARVEEKTWKELRTSYLRTRNPDGGWPDPRETCAGIYGLLITAQELGLEGDEPLRPVTKPVDYLTSHFDLPPDDGAFDLLGALACVHQLAGKGLPAAQRDALRNCYQKGVEFLLKEQAKDGSWGVGKFNGTPMFRTSCGLIFLAEMQRKPSN
jgi:hypothetical protein